MIIREEPASGSEQMVWISATGSKYHSIPDCGNMNPDKAYQEPVSQALEEGYEPWQKMFLIIPFFIEQKSVILKCMFDVRACLRERKKCNNKLVV